MAGYGSASSMGGSRGDGGSGGAFTDPGALRTPSTWHGTKAHFSGGNLKGFSTKDAAFRSPTGQPTNSNFQTQSMGMTKMPYPGGYVPPYLTQPLPPPPPPPPPPPTYMPPPPPVVPLKKSMMPGLFAPPATTYLGPRIAPVPRMTQAVAQPASYNVIDTGAYAASNYANPNLGTPGFSTGLGNYAAGSNYNSKGNLR